jgi:DNA-binding NarL/FixJ family response regulator
MRRATVLIADDHVILAEGLVSLLKDHFDVVGTAADGQQLVDLAVQLRPEVIVVDVNMPGLNGLDALALLKKKGLTSKFVILTMHGEVAIATRAIRTGASGFLLKYSAGEELVDAINEVLRGHMYLTPAITKEVLAALAAPDTEPKVTLTLRQREVLRLIVKGHRMKEIAAMLNLSTRTVETHKYEIMRQLGVGSTVELVRYALERGLA